VVGREEEETVSEEVALEDVRLEKAEEVVAEERTDESATLPQEASKRMPNPNSTEKSAFFILGNPFPNNNRPFQK
jgi:hypothetical protein